jgi:hypothetical protein
MLLRNLAHDLLMDKQASREVATAEVFGRCVLSGADHRSEDPDHAQHEELKRYQFLTKLMSELGVDMDGT